MNWTGLLVLAAGAFSIAGAVFDWDWFMSSRKARLWVSAFGRGGARIFYGVLGLAISVIGVLVLAGVVASGR